MLTLGRSRPVIFYLLLVAAGLFTFANAVGNPFVHDDLFLIVADNAFSLRDIFLNPSSLPQLLPGMKGYYRPVLSLVYALEFRLFHLHAFAYHFFNILIHVVNGLLVFALLRRMTDRKMLSWLVALGFIVHPVQSEAVASVAGLSNLLFVFFCLLSFGAYMRIGIKAAGQGRSAAILGAVCFFVLALLSKEQAAFLPGLLLVYEAALAGRKPVPRTVQIFRWAGMVLVLCGYLLWRQVVLGEALAPLLRYPQELWLRVMAIPRTLLMYGRIMIFPADLHYYRSIDILQPSGSSFVVLLLILAGIGLFVRRLEPAKARLCVFGLGWFFVGLLPTLNILPLINEYSLISNFEHFLYLPLAGFLLFAFVVVGQGLDILLKDRARSGQIVMCALVISVWMGLTAYQNTFWRGEVPLFERTLKYQKNFGRARLLLGKAYYYQQQYDRAITEFDRAIAIMNGYLQKSRSAQANRIYREYLKEAYFSQAHCWEQKGDPVRAIDRYRRAIEADPSDSRIYNNLGGLYLKQNDTVAARNLFLQAQSRNPDDLHSKANLAVCYIQMQDFVKARNLLEEVLARDPQFPFARQNLEQLRKQMQGEQNRR